MRWVCELDGESVVDVWELRDDEDELMKLDLFGRRGVGGFRLLLGMDSSMHSDGVWRRWSHRYAQRDGVHCN